MSPWQNRVYSVTRHAVGVVVNKQVKGKNLAKRINVGTEHIKYEVSRGSFLKCVKENDQEKKGSHRERYVGSTKALTWQAQREKEPDLLEAAPCESRPRRAAALPFST